jgi:hypothetical protein
MNSASAFPFHLHVNFWKACIIHIMLEFHWHSTECHFSHIHSLCGLSYDMSTASSKASSPHSVIQCFLFQFPIYSFILSSSSSCLHLLSGFPLTFILPSVFPSITRSSRQFLYEMWPIQLTFLLLIWDAHNSVAEIRVSWDVTCWVSVFQHHKQS